MRSILPMPADSHPYGREPPLFQPPTYGWTWDYTVDLLGDKDFIESYVVVQPIVMPPSTQAFDAVGFSIFSPSLGQPLVGNTPTSLTFADGINTARTYGAGDTFDSTGDFGTAARSIGPNYAYITMGMPGDRAAFFNSYHALRGALINYYRTDVIDAYGINDLSTGTSTATLEGLLTTQFSYLPTKIVYQITVDLETMGNFCKSSCGDQCCSN